MTNTTAIETDARAPRPRVRSGAIAWGFIVCAISVTVLTTIGSEEGRAGFMSWLLELGPGGQALILVLGVGFLILLLAGLSLIRRAQRRVAKRHAVVGLSVGESTISR